MRLVGASMPQKRAAQTIAFHRASTGPIVENANESVDRVQTVIETGVKTSAGGF